TGSACITSSSSKWVWRRRSALRRSVVNSSGAFIDRSSTFFPPTDELQKLRPCGEEATARSTGHPNAEPAALSPLSPRPITADRQPRPRPPLLLEQLQRRRRRGSALVERLHLAAAFEDDAFVH